MWRAFLTHEWLIREKVGKRPRPRKPRVLTNENQVFGLLANQRPVFRVLTNERGEYYLPCCKSYSRIFRAPCEYPLLKTDLPRSHPAENSHIFLVWQNPASLCKKSLYSIHHSSVKGCVNPRLQTSKLLFPAIFAEFLDSTNINL